MLKLTSSIGLSYFVVLSVNMYNMTTSRVFILIYIVRVVHLTKAINTTVIRLPSPGLGLMANYQAGYHTVTNQGSLPVVIALL